MRTSNCGAGNLAQCHLNSFLFGMVMGEGAVGIPDGSGEGSGFTALRMFALSGGVEHFENFAAMSTVVGGCQHAGPGSIDHGQREGKAELARDRLWRCAASAITARTRLYAAIPASSSF